MKCWKCFFKTFRNISEYVIYNRKVTIKLLTIWREDYWSLYCTLYCLQTAWYCPGLQELTSRKVTIVTEKMLKKKEKVRRNWRKWRRMKRRKERKELIREKCCSWGIKGFIIEGGRRLFKKKMFFPLNFNIMPLSSGW